MSEETKLVSAVGRAPGWFAWVCLAVGIAAYWPVRLLLVSWNLDGAVVNIVSWIVVGVTLLGFVTYCLLLQGKQVALVGFAVGVAVLVGLGLTVKIQTFSGSLVPRFAWRWSAEHDERLGEVRVATGSGAQVDLATTTPDDFPQFLGPTRTNVLHGVKLATDWEAQPPKLVWRREMGAGWSSFAAVNGYAVTLEQRGENELVTCLEVQTGKPRWVHSVAARHESAMGYVGPRSTPTIVDGRVFALGATGVLRCLDGADGSEIWLHDLFAENGFSQEEAEKAVMWGRSASPLVHNGLVVVPVGGPKGGPFVTLSAFDAASGKPVWTAEGKQVSYASPALMQLHGVLQIVIVNEDTVTSHVPETGEVLWEFSWPGNSAMDANVSQAVQIDDASLYVSKGYSGDAAVYDITVDDSGRWAATARWSKTVMKTKFSNVSILDGYAYGLDHGVLACVDLETGRRKWKQGRYRYGQTLLVEDVLLILSEDGEIALAAATPDKFQEYARLPALDDQTWNNPCLYGKYLLFRSKEEAACFELPLSEE